MTPDELVHKLNNALTTARGCLELLVEQPDLPPTAQTLATAALAGTERAVALLQGYQQQACRPDAGPPS
jgi:hypothetical protein